MLRATLKSLLSRKLRLVLSGLAVVLGVMFVSGSLVLTDTLGRSFDRLFTDAYAYTQIQVSRTAPVQALNGQPQAVNLPAPVVPTVAGIPGVASATGEVFADGARILGRTGKVLPYSGGPRYGTNWRGETQLINLRQGRGPTGDTEIALNAEAARRGGYALGDQVSVLTREPKQTFTLVGIFGYPGGRDSLAGETVVAFTEPVAQRLMLGEPGVFTDIDVKAQPGVRLTDLRDRIAAKLGQEYTVQTGAQLAQRSSATVRNGLRFFNYLLLGFAGVALFVGVFLILNTFSIIVAQRTHELALFRAMGASQAQVLGSVLTEAVLIGLVASAIGLGLGIGIGAGLGALLGNLLSGGTLQLAGVGVPAAAVVAAFAVGVGITVVAALLPALRAGRVAPVAAMRDIAVPDRPLTRVTVAGALGLAAGGTALGLALAGALGDATLWTLLCGLITSFVGVALLTPLVSRPVVALLGRAFGWSAAGQLGRRNSARNPRRTAITAAALMVGIALVTAVSVLVASVQRSTVRAVDQGIHAEIIIAPEPTAGGLGSIDPAAVDRIAQLPGVTTVVATYGDLAQVQGRPQFVAAVNDLPAALRMFSLSPVAGQLTLDTGSVLVDSTTADAMRLSVGSSVTVGYARGQTHTYTLAGLYRRASTVSGFVVPLADATAGFSSPAPRQSYVALAPGTDQHRAVDAVNAVLADSPEVTAQTLRDYVDATAQIFDFIIIFVQLLLGLAMVIAVLGIVNTLALSMTERTREVGLLRAVGMRRPQLAWMITVESVVISVFGALLGVAVGVGLGVAVFRGLSDQGFTDLALPWPLMVGYVLASVVVGLVAALIPAIRAARLDVLTAIAYE